MAWKDRLEALALVLFWGLARLLGPDRSSRLARAIGRHCGSPHRMRHIRRNFSFALAGAPPAAIDAAARESFGNFAAVLAELAHLDRICDPSEGRVELVIENPDCMGRKRPAVFVSAHLGNWEVQVLPIARLGMPVTIVQSPLPNPGVQRRLLEKRRRFDIELVERDGSARRLVRDLAAGRSIGVVADGRADGGELLPFFGVAAETTTVPARLALRHGCDFVPVRVERLGDARFRVTYCEPIRPRVASADLRAAARDMTEQLHALFESWIGERPGEWWCGKRRWPKSAEPRRALRTASSLARDPRAA
jgi:KDO2-lipid IV(A) lauroyltransferase